LEALAKTKALLGIEANTRIERHALGEAVLHQIHATWVALLRQAGDAHGLKPESIGSLEDLNRQLTERGLPSAEADALTRLAGDRSDWVFHLLEQYQTICCPPEPSMSPHPDAIPINDQSAIEAIAEARYRPWVDALNDLVESYQTRFDES
jgi:hypothetical protein